MRTSEQLAEVQDGLGFDYDSYTAPGVGNGGGGDVSRLFGPVCTGGDGSGAGSDDAFGIGYGENDGDSTGRGGRSRFSIGFVTTHFV